MMPVLIEVAAVDSGGGRRWHIGASPLACQLQPSRSTESTPPCIALHTVQTLGLLCYPPDTIALLVSSAALQSVCIWVPFVTAALSPGSRLAYVRLACHRAFAVPSFRRVVPRESRGSVGCPHLLLACRTSGAPPDAPQKCNREMRCAPKS